MVELVDTRLMRVTRVGVRIPPSAPQSLTTFVFSKMERAIKQKPPWYCQVEAVSGKLGR